jgi:hypothetical protein
MIKSISCHTEVFIKQYAFQISSDIQNIKYGNSLSALEAESRKAAPIATVISLCIVQTIVHVPTILSALTR